MKPSWNEYFMSFADIARSRSTCERLQVGAVIVVGKSPVATGYNGSIEGEPHCTDVGCYVENGSCIRTVHAERNALAQCARLGISTEGASIYVTHFPCLDCMKQIIRSGIKHIYFREHYKDHRYAVELAHNRGIHCTQVLDDGIENEYL